jgi:uncharacterized protein
MTNSFPHIRLDRDNQSFWTGGQGGELWIFRCPSCRYWIHPPGPICPRCLARDVRPEPVSGRGIVCTYTVNCHPWHPAFTPPYVVALVDLEEQPNLRLVSNLVEIAPDRVRIGMPVQVEFVAAGELFVPVFVPTEEQ